MASQYQILISQTTLKLRYPTLDYEIMECNLILVSTGQFQGLIYAQIQF
jgi:hypothetical protein